jgi:amylosucrase
MNRTTKSAVTEQHKGFLKRLDKFEPELRSLYNSLYGEKSFGRVLDMLRLKWSARPDSMLELDEVRIANPHWYQDSDMIGMMLYVDNFSDTFASMPAKLDYLEELGVTYLHVMPVFSMPASLNDGGYAVSDFTSIDERFGTNEEFDRFTEACHSRGISVCLDFVLNHTSDEHSWAIAAREGDPEFSSRYFIFEDRTMPDAYEATVNEVFPVLAPGNFTYNAHMESWVLTTFNHYQWDLDYRNPIVFLEMASALLQMANRGVDIFRFDAIPYIWKEWGTNCRNLPQVHSIVRMFRIFLEIVAPGAIIKGEVVMAPKDVAPYFGTEEAPECHLLYNVTLMVDLWNSLATRDTRMLGSLVEAIPDNIPSGACWVNYARCHDDIGWGFNDQKARELGFDPFQHKRFLINFYLGAFPGSFSRGELYESDPKTLDARNCGTCASLCGLEKGLLERDEYQQELAVKRIILLHTFCMAANGIPVIYSGDEIGQLNDYSYIYDMHKARDSRYLHRQKFDWAAASRRNDLSIPGSQVFWKIHRFINIRKGQRLMGSSNKLTTIATDDIGVICMLVNPRQAYQREDALVVFANFTEFQKTVTIDTSSYELLRDNAWTDLAQGKHVRLAGDPIILGPYEILLLTRST